MKHKLIPVSLSLVEIISHSIRTGNKTSLANRESQVPGVNHTSRQCFFVLRWLISLEADFGKPEKVNHSEAFRAATRGLCVTERVWTIRGSVSYSIVIGSNPLKQRQEADAKRTWRRLWEELLLEERFHVFLALGDKKKRT